jgi:hypothetical protein
VGEFDIILDNPVHEKQPIPKRDDRLWAVRAVKATSAIAPDVINDPEQSMDLLRLHLRSRIARYSETIAVVQGKTTEERKAVIRRLAQFVNYVGIPPYRWTEDRPPRNEFLRQLQDEGFFNEYPSIKVHLLGNVDLFRDAQAVRDIPQVVGIDSAKPVYLGALGIDIRDLDLAAETHRPEGFFELCADELTHKQRCLIRHNVETVQEWINGR